jgi:hypothetical protein
MSNDNAPHDPDHQPAVGGPVERMVGRSRSAEKALSARARFTV